MKNSVFEIPKPQNEPVLSYLPGSKEREDLKQMISLLKKQKMHIPVIIGGKEIFTDETGNCVIPHEKEHILAYYHKAGEKEVHEAIQSAMDAKRIWDNLDWNERASIFLKAAALISGPYRALMNAATMLAQSKTAYQAEIDAVCELCDFFRFNAYFMDQIYKEQPENSHSVWNKTEYRSLEGFVFAITPFNFTSIAGNLPTSPALCGNTVVWKPSSASVYSNYLIMKILSEAGLPDGVINFIPGSGKQIGEIVLKDRHLAGVHFTGSTDTFDGIWKTVGEHISEYDTYPRLVGETGGKDFIFVHESADAEEVVSAIVRGAFEYQGQKCSAASRVYLPSGMEKETDDRLKKMVSEIKMGDPEDFRNFMAAVIDQPSFDKIKSYIDDAKESEEAEILCGGECSDQIGYFIEPTVIKTKNPSFKTMQEEIFGPVVTIYVYDESCLEETLRLCDGTSKYALTGAVFAKDPQAIREMSRILSQAAGNFYINDKPTGAVVGQQPFGGARKSGTNDKAGSKTNLMRWISQRSIKENFEPPKGFDYPYMQEE
ncbi:MAG: L-glutamate gamma-semialdehyde dehydrogenase [Anaerofustis sp.]